MAAQRHGREVLSNLWRKDLSATRMFCWHSYLLWCVGKKAYLSPCQREAAWQTDSCMFGRAHDSSAKYSRVHHCRCIEHGFTCHESRGSPIRVSLSVTSVRAMSTCKKPPYRALGSAAFQTFISTRVTCVHCHRFASRLTHAKHVVAHCVSSWHCLTHKHMYEKEWAARVHT